MMKWKESCLESNPFWSLETWGAFFMLERTQAKPKPFVLISEDSWFRSDSLKLFFNTYDSQRLYPILLAGGKIFLRKKWLLAFKKELQQISEIFLAWARCH